MNKKIKKEARGGTLKRRVPELTKLEASKKKQEPKKERNKSRKNMQNTEKRKRK